jgi:hypothetical protein
MSNGPVLAKAVWTEADFDAMGWHDNAIYAIAVEPVPDNPGRLLLDLDYIVEWGLARVVVQHAGLLDLPGHAGLRPGVGPDRRRRYTRVGLPAVPQRDHAVRTRRTW